MENTERQKFDDAWRDAFQQAEQTPSAEVWSGLDHQLAAAEGGTMKRRVIFYQRLAAASVLFALAVGALTTYYVRDQTSGVPQEISKVQNPENSAPGDDKNQITANTNDRVGKSDANEVGNFSGVKGEVKDNSIVNSKDNEAVTHQLLVLSEKSEEKNLVAIESKKNLTGRNNERSITQRSLADITSPEITIAGKLREVTIVRKLPAMPASFMAESKKNRTKEDLWASIGASTGNYSPQINTGSVAFASQNGSPSFLNSSANNSASKGSAYSVGINMGKRISDRWVLQGGVNYLNQEIGYNSNVATLDRNNQAKAYSADYALQEAASNLAITNPYEINNVNEFVSIPMQAGYLLIDRKVGVQINSGLATDVFLQNTLTDKSGQLNKYSQGAGDSSPYRTFSWSALMGTELSYKVGSQYRLSLVPGLRYPMSQVLKAESSSVNPLFWDIGFRFRYIFK